jgi:prepilin-type N-terminal cleavage/methylation domain-containing protein/prepilin-type processing-associated H-X9-DG protein
MISVNNIDITLSVTTLERAFTLLELLMVITVLAVLGAIALPAYQKVSEGGQAAKDLSNLRQLGIAMNQYADDKGFFPGEQWPFCLYSDYVSTTDIFQSPFDKRAPSEDPNDETAPVSYDVNVNLWGATSLQIVSPTNCIFLAPLTSETTTRKFISNAAEPSLPGPLNIESNGVGATGGTYSNATRINVLFADLHVAPMSMIDFHSSLPNPDAGSSITDIRWNR